MSTVGIDLGGTNIRAMLLGEQGESHAIVNVPVGADRLPGPLVARVAELARTLVAQAPADDPVRAIGVGVAGWVRPTDGSVVRAPNLGWEDVPFKAVLEAALGLPVLPLNDLSAVTIGEWRQGAARGASSALVVFVGTGVGSGLVLGGRLYEGSGGFAGEIGHLPVVFSGGLACGCGNVGCLETVAGGKHIETRVRAAAARGQFAGVLPFADGQAERITCARIERGVQAGDVDAQALWQEVAAVLGGALGGVINLLDPEVLVLGGGVMLNAPTLRQAVIERLLARALPPIRARLRIVLPELGDPAGVVGAALGARTLVG